MKYNDGMSEAPWKQNLGLTCSAVSALGAASALSLSIGIRPWNNGGRVPIGAPSLHHPSILWLVLAVVLIAVSIGIWYRRRFKKTISLLEESKRELEGQLAERDSRIAELENELRSYSREVTISPY
jgi:hypothetical protein